MNSKSHSSSLRTVPEPRFGVRFQSSRLWNQYVLIPALEELLQLAEGLIPAAPVVFDAGCGHGAGLEWMAKRLRPSRIHAVDGDASLIEEARARASQLPLQSDVRRGELGLIDLDRHGFEVERRRTAFPRPFWTLVRQGEEPDPDTAPLCHVAAVRCPNEDVDPAERPALRVSMAECA